MESTVQERRDRSLAMLVLAAAAIAAILLALLWWKTQSAEATTDRGRIVFISSRNAVDGNYYDIYSMAPDGTDVKRITNRPGDEYGPFLSPDGQKIAFMSYTSNTGRERCCYDIFTVNSDGSGGEVNITNTPDAEESNPIFSPDGQRIAFTRGHDIYAGSADGSGGWTNLTNTDDNSELYPTWSPDSSRIAYTSHTPFGSTGHWFDANWNIYASNADGSGGRIQLTNTDRADEIYPSFSPDGSKIAYTRGDYGGEIDIYTMNSDGTNQSLVAHLPGSEYYPHWSPDGSQLAFSAAGGFTGHYAEVFKINADGSGWTNLTNNFLVDDVLGSWGESGVRDAVAPVLTLPSDITEEATGSNGGRVTFQGSAIDDLDGPLQEVSCSPASGSTFPIGTTRVECSATDAAGNVARGSFNVTVRDTTAPAMGGVPQDITKEATGPGGAQVSWQAPTATDAVDGNVNVECSPASGTIFGLGHTTVICTSTDSRGNSDTKTFNVTVKDTTAPVISGMPQDTTRFATSPLGAAVAYTSPTASDLVDGAVSVSCQPASGSNFALGKTTVGCSAADGRNNAVTRTFEVNVTYAWSGLLQPINGGSTLDDRADDTSVFKLGSTIPVKFRLTNDSASITNATAKLTLVKLDGTPNGTELEATSTNAPDSGSSFRYDPTGTQYIFNLGTKSLTAGDYVIKIDLGDGTTATNAVTFSLKK